ncbi:MAG: hypothetical protein ACI37Z_01715 [Candidatus Gastranaerophilaceae bacterium]
MDNKKNETGKTAAYSVLTLILLIFIIQSGFGMIINIFRNIDIYAKLKYVNKAHVFATKRNKNLKYELKSFNSAKSLEAIARNNLKMAGTNEVLLIINSPIETDKEKHKTKAPKQKGIFYKR